MSAKGRSKSWPNGAKVFGKTPPPSPVSPKTSLAHSLNALNLPPRSPTSFFYYSSSYSDLYSRYVSSSQSSCELSSSPRYSGIKLRDLRHDYAKVRKDMVSDDGKRIKLSFSDNFVRAYLLSQTLSLSFQPHTPTLSLVTFSCLADDVHSKSKSLEQSESMKAKSRDNVSRKRSGVSKAKTRKKKIEKNLTNAKKVQSTSEVTPRVTPIPSSRSLLSQSPTISLVALSLSGKDCSICHHKPELSEGKRSIATSDEELTFSFDESSSMSKDPKLIGKAPTKIADKVPASVDKTSGNTKKSTVSKSTDKKKCSRNGNAKDTMATTNSKKEKTAHDNQTKSSAEPTALPPPAPRCHSEPPEPVCHSGKYSRYWPHLEAIYKNAGARFRLSASEDCAGSSRASARPKEGLARPALVHLSLSRKGLEVVQNSSRRKLVPHHDDTAPFPCMPSVSGNNRTSSLAITRHIEETWTNSIRDSERSDSEASFTCLSYKSFTIASSSSDRERESVESQEESNPSRPLTSRAKLKGGVRFSTAPSNEGTEAIIRCVVRERNQGSTQSTANTNSSPRSKSKNQQSKDNSSAKTPSSPAPKTKPSQTTVREKVSTESISKSKTSNEPKNKIAASNVGDNKTKTPSSPAQKEKNAKGKIQKVPNIRQNKQILPKDKVAVKPNEVPSGDSPTGETTEGSAAKIKGEAPSKPPEESKTNLKVSITEDSKKTDIQEPKLKQEEESTEVFGQSNEGSTGPFSKKNECKRNRRCVAKRRKRSAHTSRGKSVDRATSPITEEISLLHGCIAKACPQNKKMCDIATTVDIMKNVNRAQQTVPVVNLQYPRYAAVLSAEEKPSPTKNEAPPNSSKSNSKSPQRQGVTKGNDRSEKTPKKIQENKSPSTPQSKQRTNQQNSAPVHEKQNKSKDNNNKSISKPTSQRKPRSTSPSEGSSRPTTSQEKQKSHSNKELAAKPSQEKQSNHNKELTVKPSKEKQRPHHNKELNAKPSLRNNEERTRTPTQERNKQRTNEGSNKSSASQDKQKPFVSVKSSPFGRDKRRYTRCTLKTSARKQKPKVFKSASASLKKSPSLPQKNSKSLVANDETAHLKPSSKTSLNKLAEIANRFLINNVGSDTKGRPKTVEASNDERENVLDKKYSHTSTDPHNPEHPQRSSLIPCHTYPAAEPRFYGSENITSKVIPEKPSYFTVNTCLVGRNYTNYGWIGAMSHGQEVPLNQMPPPSQQRKYSCKMRRDGSGSTLSGGSSTAERKGSSGSYYATSEYSSQPSGYGSASTRYDARSPLNHLNYGTMPLNSPCYFPRSSGDIPNGMSNGYTPVDSSYGGYRNFRNGSNFISNYNNPPYEQPTSGVAANHYPTSMHIASCPSFGIGRLNSPNIQNSSNWPMNAPRHYCI